MIILDTDVLTLLERGGTATKRLIARLDEAHPTPIATTIVTFEEHTRG